jgi:hypothetical protein
MNSRRLKRISGSPRMPSGRSRSSSAAASEGDNRGLFARARAPASFTAYLSTNPSAATGAVIPKCPKTIVASTPPCLVKLTRDGQNSDLKVVISVPGTPAFADPKSGIR